MKRSLKIFQVIAAAQAVFLLAWAGAHEYIRQHAETIILKGRPVDPQDLLRGDYMILSYDIGTPPAGELGGREEYGQDVWVLLEKRERYHVAVRASREKPEPGPGQILVRGKTAYTWAGAPRVAIDYGIEKYFVPEGRGTPRFQLLEVEAAVSPAHRLYLKQVLLDGKPFP
jgi:uncharacterized membrane-anchored protein